MAAANFFVFSRNRNSNLKSDLRQLIFVVLRKDTAQNRESEFQTSDDETYLVAEGLDFWFRDWFVVVELLYLLVEDGYFLHRENGTHFF